MLPRFRGHHSHLDYVSPIEFELKMHIAAIAG
jgi:hypothetical protein